MVHAERLREIAIISILMFPTGCGKTPVDRAPTASRPIDGTLAISSSRDATVSPGEEIEFSGSYRGDGSGDVMPAPIVKLIDESTSNKKSIASAGGTRVIDGDTAKFTARFKIPRDAKPGVYRAVASAHGVEFASLPVTIK